MHRRLRFPIEAISSGFLIRPFVTFRMLGTGIDTEPAIHDLHGPPLNLGHVLKHDSLPVREFGLAIFPFNQEEMTIDSPFAVHVRRIRLLLRKAFVKDAELDKPLVWISAPVMVTIPSHLTHNRFPMF